MHAAAVVGEPAREITPRTAQLSKFVAIEVGHAAQNVYLQAHALGLGTTAVGGFNATEAHSALGLPDDEDVLLMMPVGLPGN